MAFSLAGLAPLAGLAQGYQQGMDWRQQQALRGFAIQQAQEQQQVLPTIYAAVQQLGSLQGLANVQATSSPPPTTGDTTVPVQPMSAPSAPSPNALQLAQNFTNQGYPPAAAAGLVGALTGESGPGLNPQAVGDSGAGVGIASWEGPRRAALQRLPAAQSFPTQARFAASELAPGGSEAATGQALRNFTGTPQQAAALATTGYLRPNQNAPGYAASMQQRQQAAQQVYQALGGQPTEAQAQPLAQAAGAQVPPQMQGMAQLGQLAQLIERTAPAGTPDNVKAMALFQLHQMLAPDQKQMLAMQLQVFKDQMRFETDTEIARMRAQQPPTQYQQGTLDERARHDQVIEAERGGSAGKQAAFGSTADLMERWHQDFLAKNHREPTTDEISAQRAALTQESKPPGRQLAQMTQRLMIGANEVNRAVSAISELPAGTTLGWFGGAQAGMEGSPAENVRRNLANAITPQSAQILKALTNGVTRGLAILEAGGAAQGLVGLSRQLQADLPQENDTGLTIAAKYADIRQIVEAATEVLSANPELGKDQRTLLNSINASIKKAVPFTTADVARLSADPSEETISQFARRVGLDKSGAAAHPDVQQNGVTFRWQDGAYKPVQ